MKYGRTRNGKIELWLSQNPEHFKTLAESVRAALNGRWTEQVGDLDSTYWDLDVQGMILTVHRQHYLGVSVFTEDKPAEIGLMKRLVKAFGSEQPESAFTSQLPLGLRTFLHTDCGIDVAKLDAVFGFDLPQPARRLLDHDRDMTSTLATHHGSALRVEVLRCRTEGGLYLREVFLRTIAAVGPVPADRIVEYGVLAVALAQFSPEARAAIEAGRKPLGALLHEFKIPFVSAPIGFFSADDAALAATPLAVPAGARCFGRFNCLSLPAGEPLAWIMEILPPPSAS